jgi:glucose-6-phosphate 1-epimerase
MSSASDIITITHSKSGASVGIHPYGATVVSYKSANGRENLFVSSLAKLDGSKPIRGGIPLVFPIHGPPPKAHSGSTMPPHGFARNNVWKVKEGSQHDMDSHSGISFTLDLKDVTNGRGEHNPWSIEQAKVDGTSCSLTLDVKIDEKELTTTLVIVNDGTDAFDFNSLQRTYFKVDNHAAQDPKECYVHGLGGFSTIDKVNEENTGKMASYDDDITFDVGEVDKVHLHSEDHNTIKVKIGVGDGKTI